MDRFQYFSDVHTEFCATSRDFVPSIPLAQRAPYLLLAGDIGYPKHLIYGKFLRRVSRLFAYVFLVAGNHEYYRSGPGRRQSAEEAMRDAERSIRDVIHPLRNVIYLQGESCDVPGIADVTVFGATLWSNVLPEEETRVTTCLSDYEEIPQFTVRRTRELFREHTERLKECVKDTARRGRRLVVLTHHLPSYALVARKYKSCGFNSGFASDLEDVAREPCVVAWVAGHTHVPVELGKFHVNPIGYPNERTTTTPKADYNKTFSI